MRLPQTLKSSNPRHLPNFKMTGRGLLTDPHSWRICPLPACHANSFDALSTFQLALRLSESRHSQGDLRPTRRRLGQSCKRRWTPATGSLVRPTTGSRTPYRQGVICGPSSVTRCSRTFAPALLRSAPTSRWNAMPMSAYGRIPTWPYR